VNCQAQWVVWFFRVIEEPDGWTCRRGSVAYDTHAVLEQAIDHIRNLALDQEPAQLVLHRLDGTVQRFDAV
jgi:hypothetical protein